MALLIFIYYQYFLHYYLLWLLYCISH